MADLAAIERALRAADAAGNTEDAKRLAQAYAQAKAQQAGSTDTGIGQLISGQRKPAAYRAADKVGMGQALGALDGLTHHVLNIPEAIGQLSAHGVNALVQGVAGGSGYAKGVQSRLDAQDAGLRKREAAYQARTDGNAGSYLGATVGEVAPWMVGIGELRAAGLLSKVAKGQGFLGKSAEIAKKAGLLGLEGAAMGAAQPVTGEGSYGAQKALQVGSGAVAAPVIGGTLAAGGATARGAGRLARYATDSGREKIAAERLAKLYGNSPEVIAQLERAGSGVPGVQPTVAQALATPEAIQAERMLRNNGASAASFAMRESQNNAALRNEAQGLAGTDEALQAAVAARREGPGAFWRDNLPRGAEDGRYKRAQAHLAGYLNSKPIPMPEFKILDEARKILGQVQRGTIEQGEASKLLAELAPKTRAGQRAMEQAQGILNNGMTNPNRLVRELETLAKDPNATIAAAAEGHLRTIAKNQDGEGWIHARVLDGIRQNIGTMLSKNAPNGVVGTAEGAAYGPLAAKIANQVNRTIPGYRDNLAAYARASQPINDMEAGRALLSAIDSGGRDAGGNQAVTLNHLKSLIAKDNRARYPMSAEARARVERMIEALQQRSVTNNTIAATGPGTAADTMRGFATSPMGTRLLSLLAGGGGMAVGGLPGLLAGGALSEGLSAANASVLRKLGTKGADAKLAAATLRAQREAEANKQLSPLLRMLLPYEQRALPPPTSGGR